MGSSSSKRFSGHGRERLLVFYYNQVLGSKVGSYPRNRRLLTRRKNVSHLDLFFYVHELLCLVAVTGWTVILFCLFDIIISTFDLQSLTQIHVTGLPVSPAPLKCSRLLVSMCTFLQGVVHIINIHFEKWTLYMADAYCVL